MDIGLSTYDFTQHGAAQNIEMLDSKEEAILRDIEKFSGVKYSDEQLQVLRHKGGMCVVVKLLLSLTLLQSVLNLEKSRMCIKSFVLLIARLVQMRCTPDY